MHPPRRPRLRRERLPPAADPGAGREQRRDDGGAAPHGALPGARPRRPLGRHRPVLGVAAAYGVVVWTRRDGRGVQAPVRRPARAPRGDRRVRAAQHRRRGPRPRPPAGPARHRRRHARPERLAPAQPVALRRPGWSSPAVGSALLVTATGAVRAARRRHPGPRALPRRRRRRSARSCLILGSLFLVPLILAGVGRRGRPARDGAADGGARPRPAPGPQRPVGRGRPRGRRRPDLRAHRPGERHRAAPAASTCRRRSPARRTLSARAEAPRPRRGRGARIVPGAIVTQNQVVDTGDPWQSGQQPTAPYRLVFVNVLRPGCTPETVPRLLRRRRPTADAAARRRACGKLGTTGMGDSSVLVLPADELVRRLDLDAAPGRRGPGRRRGRPWAERADRDDRARHRSPRTRPRRRGPSTPT